MLTIKYIDLDGLEHLHEGSDFRTKMDGRYAKSIGWRTLDGGGAMIDFTTTAYVMNDAGATVAKYVVLGEGVSLAGDELPQQEAA